MKQDKINFDTTTIEDNHLNTEDILERHKEISNSIADAASAISPVFSEQLNEFISKINASEYFKNYEEALKPLTESLIKSFAYSWLKLVYIGLSRFVLFDIKSLDLLKDSFFAKYLRLFV